ncbi:immune inhibitor A domain-containing protein [Promicromonospora thailandica]|uniref:Immune inhibitor A n=1 Tax=Promicromonospora thailandica TaxID=765201 RepID=A0A9X2JYI6_9MICO|nr:immune inhibitor A domain-containing protein [Promicromonospora thailandica]MCP2265114.1 immune inhibitor A [Promicromonospora thailandica]
MNPRICAVGAGAALLLSAAVVPITASAAPPAEEVPQQAAPAKEDNRPDALAEKQNEKRQRAVNMVATGEAKVETRGKGKHKSKVVKISPREYVEYGVEETAQLFSILVDFGDEVDERYPDASAGPVHNQIPEPPRSDNSTYWEPDFSREHFQEMFFTGLEDQDGESFAGIYDEMSSGRFDLQGDVSDWVTVPYNTASYGTTESGEDMTRFIQDTANAWYEQQVAAGKTAEEIDAYLQSFDVWDRYDMDGDGITAEPDGYIDHFQAIHAGEGEEAGAPEEAIWSHRWAVNQGGLGSDGPADFEKLGGIKIGDSDIWIRDYTTEPENGGLGVFAHEFGHDLGLPDYYDTAGGENGTGFWNLMSSGSWMGHGTGTIGTTPNHMGATEKLFLGWLDYEAVAPGERDRIKLGPSFHATTRAQAAIVDLPDGVTQVDIGEEYGVEPLDGEFVYSGTGNNLNTTITSPSFTVPDGASLTAKVQYAIEDDFDYAFAEISTDGGSTWTALPNNLSTDEDPNGTNPGGGITGDSAGAWVDLTADLGDYAGQTASVRFRYASDGGANETGIAVDDVTVGDALSEDFTDSDWTADGFVTVGADGTYEVTYQHYYVAENRVYGGYDQTLRTGPYNFGWTFSNSNKVEHYPYQDGLLVWYVNSLYGDNNTSQHPGGGQALPVDARAKALKWSGGTIARNRIQSFDATFGLQKTDPISLHREVAANSLTTLKLGKQKAVSTFDDTNPNAYYDPANPGHSVKVGGTGTTIKVLTEDTKKGHMTIQVN